MKKRIIAWFLTIVMIFAQMNLMGLEVFADTTEVQTITLNRSVKYLFPEGKVTIEISDFTIADTDEVVWTIAYLGEDGSTEIVVTEGIYYEVSEDQTQVILDGDAFKEAGLTTGDPIIIRLSIVSDGVETASGQTKVWMREPVYNYYNDNFKNLSLNTNSEVEGKIPNTINCNYTDASAPSWAVVDVSIKRIDIPEEQQGIVSITETETYWSVKPIKKGLVYAQAVYDKLESDEEVYIPVTIFVGDRVAHLDISSLENDSESYITYSGGTIGIYVRAYGEICNENLKIEFDENTSIKVANSDAEGISYITYDTPTIEKEEEQEFLYQAIWITTEEDYVGDISLELALQMDNEYECMAYKTISVKEEYYAIEYPTEELDALEDLRPGQTVVLHPELKKYPIIENNTEDLSLVYSMSSRDEEDACVTIDANTGELTIKRLNSNRLDGISIKATDQNKGYLCARTLEVENYNYVGLFPTYKRIESNTEYTFTMDSSQFEGLEDWTIDWNVYFYKEGEEVTISNEYYDDSINGSITLYDTITQAFDIPICTFWVVEWTLTNEGAYVHDGQLSLYMVGEWLPNFGITTEVELLDKLYFDRTQILHNGTIDEAAEVEITNISCESENAKITETDSKWKVFYNKTGIVELTIDYTINGKKERTNTYNVTVTSTVEDPNSAVSEILADDEIEEDEVEYLNDVVGTLFVGGEENNAELVLENGLSMDEIADLEILYVENNENVGETIVDGDEAFAQTQVEGAALAIVPYSYDSEEEYSAQLSFEQVTDVNEYEELQELVNKEAAFVLDINLSVVDSSGETVEGAEDIQPAAPIRISMPLPEEWVGKEFELYHYVDDSDEPVKVEYTIEDGMIVFVATSFSFYSLEMEWIPTVAPQESVTVKLYGHDDIEVNWSSQAVEGCEVKYKVEYMVYGGSYETLTEAETGTSLKKANLADGKKYRFRVTPYVTVNGTNYYGDAKVSAYIYTLKKLSAPTVVKASDTTVKVSWTNIAGETGYQISRSTSKTGTNIVATYATTSGTSKVITPKKQNTTYYYKVRAYKTVGDTKIYGPWSAVTDYNLRYVYPVTDVKAVLYGYDDVKVTWTKAAGANAYAVYYKKSTASSYTYYKTVTGTTCKKADLADGVKYTFKVVPQYKVDGKVKLKGTADTATVTTLKKLSAPTVTKYSSTKVKVKWTNIADETGYQISRSTSKTKTNIVVTYATTSGTYKTITPPKTNTTYYYKVRAYKTVDGTKIFGPWSAVTAFNLK